ncbi:hypothetical protein JRQ81_000043 [Phrynocephalus forsythii]|uniref:COP9 signalosome complex subunit 6 n=1 Tax=Phrynocephalus forsythii TaxID=171643 RepID=A0A9Q0X5K3_9SAUR|nr:hypothetical protein JRQ81_000043 [Phrynocephalus forsythii]
MASSSGAGTMSSSSGLTFKLHPLVIVNISDHYTRLMAQAAATGSAGIPLPARLWLRNRRPGRAQRRDLQQLRAQARRRHGFLDRPFLETKQEQYKKVFPMTTSWAGAHGHQREPRLPPPQSGYQPRAQGAPLSIYESELHVIDGVPSLIFVKASYTIETVEAERISVDHVAHIKPSDGSSAATQLAAHLTGMHSAIKMLHSRIKVLHHLLAAIQKGDAPPEHALLRQVSSLVRRLPAIDLAPKFQDDFLMEYNDTLLMTYLATITKCSNTMNEFVEKFTTAYDKQSPRGGRTVFV